MKYILTSCIVLYNNNIEMLEQAIHSFLNTDLNVKLFLIDNSPTDVLKVLKLDDRIEYLHNPSNPGFGAAHNVAFNKAKELDSKYHFIVNPDIYFTDSVIETMLEHMENDSSIGMMMPKILYPDGSTQYLPKLLPTPLDILRRKFRFPRIFYEKFINQYELRGFPQDIVYEVPIISGCFSVVNMDAIDKVGMYDDAFFMYFEDWDLSRRIHQEYKTLYFPLVSVYHEYERGAGKNAKLFKIFLKSSIHYFNKWGWFFDRDRKLFNQEVLSQFKQ